MIYYKEIPYPEQQKRSEMYKPAEDFQQLGNTVEMLSFIDEPEKDAHIVI